MTISKPLGTKNWAEFVQLHKHIIAIAKSMIGIGLARNCLLVKQVYTCIAFHSRAWILLSTAFIKQKFIGGKRTPLC